MPTDSFCNVKENTVCVAQAIHKSYMIILIVNTSNPYFMIYFDNSYFTKKIVPKHIKKDSRHNTAYIIYSLTFTSHLNA